MDNNNNNIKSSKTGHQQQHRAEKIVFSNINLWSTNPSLFSKNLYIEIVENENLVFSNRPNRKYKNQQSFHHVSCEKFSVFELNLVHIVGLFGLFFSANKRRGEKYEAKI